MEETIKCAPKIPINLLPSLNTDCIQLKDTLKKSGYKKLFYPFLTLPHPAPPPHPSIASKLNDSDYGLIIKEIPNYTNYIKKTLFNLVYTLMSVPQLKSVTS